MDSQEGFDEIYRQYAQPIYRFIYWQTKNPDLAGDLTSAVFERAWRSRAQFHGGSVQAWLYRIARNLVIDHWRKKKELLMDDVTGLADQLADQTPAYDFDAEKLVWQLSQALETLDEEVRAVVVLRFIEGLSAREVADTLGMTEGNVRIIQFRALRKLRKLMDHD